MLIATSMQMRAIDQRTIHEFGITGFDLMNRAGKAVCDAAIRDLGRVTGRRILIFCGKGNNGGDGFAAARYLLEEGASVHCCLQTPRDQYTGDAAAHLAMILQTDASVSHIPVDQLAGMPVEADLIIDAILGTGIRGSLRGWPAEAVKCINHAASRVLSVDMPSGLSGTCDFPDPDDLHNWPCILADRTLAIGLRKIELALYPGLAWAGIVETADIGFPAAAVAAENIQVFMPDHAEMNRLIPTHRPEEHKGDRGKVAIVAGSVGMAGAATLTAQAAMRAGAGMALLGAPASLLDVLAVKLTEVMLKPLPETDLQSTGMKAAPVIENMTTWADALAIGPGMTRHPETSEVIRKSAVHSPLPLVLDADGINAFIGYAEQLADCKSEVVITPHIGEMSRLTEMPPETIFEDRILATKQTAEKLRVIVVLKGACTVAAHPDGKVSINPTGNPGMATAGSGDVLTGIITALISQRLTPWDAARLGVYLHGLAGDIGCRKKGPHSLIARDIISCLPCAFKEVTHDRN